MNQICIVGRLVRDPELKTTSTGKAVASFTVAVNRKFKDSSGENSADFFRCTAWQQSAEFICNYGGKGRMVSVTGRCEQRKYTDRDGNEREAFEVVADNVALLDRAPDDGGGAPRGNSNAPATNGKPTAKVAAGPSPDDYDPFADD